MAIGDCEDLGDEINVVKVDTDTHGSCNFCNDRTLVSVFQIECLRNVQRICYSCWCELRKKVNAAR